MQKQSLINALKEATLEDLQSRSLEPVEVVVLDTGVDASHPDLKNRVTAAFIADMNEKGRPSIVEVPTQTHNDASSHGTAVASIIARMAPNAQIVDIRVMGKDNKGGNDLFVAGLQHALKRKSRILNMSLALKRSLAPKIWPLIDKAYEQNQIVVAAKRNVPLFDSGVPAEFSSNLSIDNDDLPSPFDTLYKTNNFIEFGALGVDVPVASAGGGYTTMTGTSFATPTISGIIALLVGAYPDLRPFDVKSILRAFSTEIDGREK